jgi:nicotinate-nucleotide pyrophosphorylase
MIDPLEIGLLEDCPYNDETTELLNIEGNGNLKIISRVTGITSGTIRLKEFFESKGLAVASCLKSSSPFQKDDILFEADGDIKMLFKLWRISQTYLSLMCAIATDTNEIVQAGRKVNKNLDIVVATRKAHLGMREAEIDAIEDGGATYHRNSLSDTILITQNHLNAVDALPDRLHSVRHKIEIEPRSEDEAYATAKHVDVVLLDHFEPQSLAEISARLKEINPAIKVGVAGGIDKNNIESFAKAVDMIVLSSVLFAKPLNLTCKVKPAG